MSASYPAFLFQRKLRFYETKNAPRGSHCGGVEAVAGATRRRVGGIYSGMPWSAYYQEVTERWIF